jgi:hypothetical protein
MPPKLFVVEPNAHGAQSDVDTALYCPATHAVQFTAPAPDNVSVTKPAWHIQQPDCSLLPWYWPAAQSAQSTVDCGLYRPVPHSVHAVALADASVSVTDPTWHAAHAVVEFGLYWPAVHAVHAVARGLSNTSVSEPGGHSAHATVDSALYCPVTHAAQLMAPVSPNALVIEPGSHASQ